MKSLVKGRYITAEINTGKPFIITDAMDGAISKFVKYDTMLGNSNEYIKETFEEDGVFTGIKLIMIDLEKVGELSHIQVIREGGERIDYEDLVNIILSEIRNIKINSVLD